MSVRRRFLVAIAATAAFSSTLSAQTPAPAVAPAPANPNGWRIDKGHSILEFSIRHFMSRVKGTFREWQGTVTLEDPAKWENATVDVAITTSTVFTDHERRDADLRSNNFFAADSFPAISFKSNRIERNGDSGRIHGILTIRGRSRPVVLEGKFLGLQKQSGNQGTTERFGFEAATMINRLDYGVSWNRAVEGGGVMLGDEVRIEIAIEATRRAGGPPAGDR
jgi:polyisoprenoid-binding protein YceI